MKLEPAPNSPEDVGYTRRLPELLLETTHLDVLKAIEAGRQPRGDCWHLFALSALRAHGYVLASSLKLTPRGVEALAASRLR